MTCRPPFLVGVATLAVALVIVLAASRETGAAKGKAIVDSKHSASAPTMSANTGNRHLVEGGRHEVEASGHEGMALLKLPDGEQLWLPEERTRRYQVLFEQYQVVQEEAQYMGRVFSKTALSGPWWQQVAQAHSALQAYHHRYALEDAGVTLEMVAEALELDTPDSEAPERLEVPAALQFTRQVEVLEGGLVAVNMWVAPAVEAEETVVGATLSQRFPGGWEMVEAEPGASVYSPKEHVVKWLVQSAVTTPVNIRFVVRPTSEQAKAQDWQMLPAWVLFRQAGEERRLLVGGAAL